MDKTAYVLLAAMALAAADPLSAQAGEQKLKFRFVTQMIGEPGNLPEIAGHKITAGHYMGVATFEDGRIAHKDFVDVSDDTENSGTFKGYSTYTFQNGDSITASYTGGWDAGGAHGDYQVVSGTGAFSGASGTGGFTAAEAKWTAAAFLWDGWFDLKTPGS